MSAQEIYVLYAMKKCTLASTSCQAVILLLFKIMTSSGAEFVKHNLQLTVLTEVSTAVQHYDPVPLTNAVPVSTSPGHAGFLSGRT